MSLGISAGIADFAMNEDAGDLLHRADCAMYENKRSSR